jgi:hypothetical protein
MSELKPLRLIANSDEDLPAISAALQDAVCQIGDLQYQASAGQFTLALNRFCWEAGEDGKGLRVRTGVQVGAVERAQSQNLKAGATDAVISLLSIQFEAGDAPSGALVFTFSGGGLLRLEVECLDIALADVSEPWRAIARPDHSGA